MKNNYLSAAPISPELMKSIVDGTGKVFGAVAGMRQDKWSQPDCGKKPFFIGKRRREWEACATMKRNEQSAIMPKKGSFAEKNKTLLIVGGAAVLLILILKAKK